MKADAQRLRAEVEQTLAQLASLRRPSASDGEHAAARLLRDELDRRGVVAHLEGEEVHGTYWWPLALTAGLAVAGGLGGRAAAAVAGSLAAAEAAEDLELGPRLLRRALGRRTCHNVLATIGPRDAKHTLVIHAHHDAARTGFVFHPQFAKLAARHAGRLMERVGGTPAPMWSAIAGPVLVAAGGLLDRRLLRRAGALGSLAFLAAMLDVARSPAVPGANDNLSGVCVLLWLAAALAERPPRSLRVLLLSTGSEESFLEAMERFGQRHFPHLDRRRTFFLCLESVGSPQLMLLGGEGFLKLHRYPRGLMAELTRLAGESGVALRDPFDYRLATDGQVPLRAGYPTAVISSMDWYKAPSNYHWPNDRPENLDFGSIAGAATLAEALVRRLDA